MAPIYLVARRFWAQKCERTLGLALGKSLKLLILLSFSCCFLACASSQGTAFDRQLLVESEEKNARLEAEVTRLREEKLRGEPKSDCLAKSRAATTLSSDDSPENLPVVEMNPPEPGEELEAGAAVIRPAESLPEEEPVDDDTRPVLKVRGRHEAFVYHRAVTAEDREAKTGPASDSTPLPEDSN